MEKGAGAPDSSDPSRRETASAASCRVWYCTIPQPYRKKIVCQMRLGCACDSTMTYTLQQQKAKLTDLRKLSRLTLDLPL